MSALIVLHKDGDNMAIETDAKDEGDFLQSMGALLSQAIDAGDFAGDWEFQFSFWLPQMVDICCKLRGYKNEVHERRVLIAGSPTAEHPVMSIDSRGDVHGVGKYAFAKPDGGEETP